MPRSPLGWLDLIVPKDAGSRRIAADLAYGPDPRHRLDLFAPKRINGPLPLMIFVYGGGWHEGTREDYSFAGRAFAALGFLTAVIDYRLVPEVHFPAFVEDCGRAASWLQAQAATYGGDRDRVVLSGHSAGAYNAVTLALDPARFGAPGLVGHIEAVIGLSGPYDFYPFDVRESRDAFANYPEPKQTQPVELVTPAAPPMLLVHGNTDTVVGLYNSVHLAEKLRNAGVPVEERHYPRMGHPHTVLALMRPFRPVWPEYRDIAAFLDRRLTKGAAASETAAVRVT
jgi:acetyl esterase/lipase